jgi:hypothetical protein
MLDMIRRAKQAAENNWYNAQDEHYPYDLWASIAHEPERRIVDTSATIYSKKLRKKLGLEAKNEKNGTDPWVYPQR